MAREPVVPADRDAGPLQASREPFDVVDADAGMRFASRHKLALDTEVELHRTGSEPGAAPGGEGGRLGDLGHAQHPAVEAARLVVASRWHRHLHVMMGPLHNPMLRRAAGTLGVPMASTAQHPTAPR